MKKLFMIINEDRLSILPLTPQGDSSGCKEGRLADYHRVQKHWATARDRSLRGGHEGDACQPHRQEPAAGIADICVSLFPI